MTAWRRGSVPEDVEVAAGERVLTLGRTPYGAPVAVTRDALYLPTPAGEVRRIRWDQVEHATWDSPVLQLLVEGAADPTRVVLEDPGRVPEAVRERVTSAIVVAERVELSAGVGAEIIGRRTGDGTALRWRVTFDPGVDPNDPVVRAAADREIARLKTSYGP